MSEIATKSTWVNHPIDHPKRIEINLQFTGEQFYKLSRGLIPQEMEDKWFIYYENGWLYFHRSWTGLGIYKAKLIKEPGGYSIHEFWAERNKEKYGNDNDDDDRDTISFLIARGLLGIDVRSIYSAKHHHSIEDSVKGWSKFGNLMFTSKGIDNSGIIKSALFGVAVGDALGVPVEFKSREALSRNPVDGMMGHGTHNQPPGTWSDDSSLTFCLADALTTGFDLNLIGQNFIKWAKENYWTPAGDVFDIGIATKRAIEKLVNGVPPDLAGGSDEMDNGNGSLMRILPLLFLLTGKPLNERYGMTKQVSSITHGHIRSVISCFYYLEFARQLLEGKEKFDIFKNLQEELTPFLKSIPIKPLELAFFDRLLKENIYEQPVEVIKSSGYVIHTLEAAIWCLLTTGSFRDAVLKAVNLGEDTDTTGAVTGGLAGLLYGFNNIPAGWLQQIARYHDIENLAERFAGRLTGS